MKSSSILLVILIFLVAAACPAAVHAQFFKNLVNTVKQTATGRANDKTAQTTNKVLDKVDPTAPKSPVTPKPNATASATSNAPATGIPATTTMASANTVPGQGAGSATSGPSPGNANPPPGDTESDSSYLQLKLSAVRVLLHSPVVISGTSIRYGSMKDVALTITGPSTNYSKTIPLSDNGAFSSTWVAPLSGNYKVLVKSSNGKEQATAFFDIFKVVNIDSIINDNMEGTKHAFDNLQKRVADIKSQLGPSDADQLQKTMDKVTKNKDQAIKLFSDMIDMGKGLDAIEKKYGGLSPGITDNLSQLSTIMSSQAKQIAQANSVADHKAYDNTICEMLVMVSEACAAFSAFSNIWTKSVTGVLKNIALDKGVPGGVGAAAGSAGTPGTTTSLGKEAGKVAATSVLDAESMSSAMGVSGFTGDLVQMCSDYFLKKYCAVMSGDVKQDYKCTFTNKDNITWWDYSYTTEATISLRYPKSGSTGKIIKMKGNIEGNATKFTIYQKASEQDEYKKAMKNRASLFSICLYTPAAAPFSTSQADKNVGFGAVARAIVTPAYFNIPIDADYDTEAQKLKIYCNEAIVDFSGQVKYVYAYIAIAAGIPLVTRVEYPINKVKLTMAKVIEKNNDFTMQTDANHNLFFTKTANFRLGAGSPIEHNINLTVTAKSE
ncbi:MAG TPA: hypothetical protein VK563_06915 [Puia sp.]|nr:hypothetical protein [Puia sp.]